MNAQRQDARGSTASGSARDWDATPSVVRARALLANGRFRQAVNEAWRVAELAVRTDDERGYFVVQELAREIGERASGRPQRNAVVLGTYISHCRTTSAAGIWSGSLLTRLFGSRTAEQTKKCPECAETVKAAARICRFCNHRFSEV